MPRRISPSALLRRRFIYNGLMGRNRKWLILGGAAWGFHLMRRVLGASEVRPVYVEDLLPGEQLTITHMAPRPKRRR